MTVVNPKSISGINSITTGSGSDNLLTIHTSDASSTERVRINSSGDVIVGSGVTVSPDGDIFTTGVTTATTFVGALTGNVTGNVTGNISGGTVAGSTGTFTGAVTLADDVANGLKIGAGEDLILQHNGTNSFIDNNTGDLYIQTTGSGDDILIESADDITLKVAGSETAIQATGDGAVELYHNNNKRLATYNEGIAVFGIEGGNASIKLNADEGDDNNDQYRLIAGDGTSIYLQNYASGSWESNIVATGNGSVDLYYDNVKKFETHDVGTIFTEAGSGSTQAAIKVNTTLDTYGSVTVRDKRDVDNAVAAFQVENASNGSNETNLLLRSVNLGSTAFSHGLYAAKSHRFGVSSNVTPTVQIDSDGLKFNNDQASDNALNDYEEGTWTPTAGSDATITIYNARYTKVGQAVSVVAYVGVSNGNSNPVIFSGLPFTNRVQGWNASILSTNESGTFLIRARENTTQMDIKGNADAATNYAQFNSDFWVFSFTYFTAS